jgi:two-component system, NarL family, nitrate/nitrite response regulator NarL
MTAAIKVVIIDHQSLFRIGIAQALSRGGICDVVAEGAGLEDALRLARQRAPDVMVLDLYSELSGEAVRRICAECASMRTLVLTVLADPKLVSSTLQAGAAGYVHKRIGSAELADIVERVHRGESYVDPALAARLLQAAPAKLDPFSTLSIREEQVLGHLVAGLSNREIGSQLGLKERTVKHYLSSLLKKLDARTRVEAAMLAKGRSTLHGVARDRSPTNTTSTS